MVSAVTRNVVANSSLNQRRFGVAGSMLAIAFFTLAIIAEDAESILHRRWVEK